MKTQLYNNFWQRIHNTAREKGTLLRVMFELTYRCNFKCKHCYVPCNYRNKKGELKTKEVFSVLDQLADIGCFYLGFTGGEVFLRKDTMKILWYAKRRGFEVIIYTNGSLINEKIADELALLRPNKVDITIPAMSKKALEKITLSPGSHKRIFKAIDLLYKRRIDLGFKTCVLKENESEIKEIQDFAASLGALHRLDDTLSPRLDGSKEPYKYRGTLLNANRRESNANKRESIDANKRECLNDDISENSRYSISDYSRLFKCGVGETQAAISPFGELKMCLMIDYPKTLINANLRMRMNANRRARIGANKYWRGLALKNAWSKLRELTVSIKPDENYQCDKCEVEPYCKWCPGKAWLYNGTFTSCEPESRKKAEEKKQLLNC